MSNALYAAGLGGIHATARRSGIAEDIPFIQAKRRQGVPDTAIANMIGRSVAVVRGVEREAAEPPREAPDAGRKRRRPTMLLSLYRGLIPAQPPVGLSAGMREILADVAAHRGFTVEELRGSSRRWPLVHARWAAMYLMYETGRWTLPQIGGFFRKDHTTVLHGIRKHAELHGLPPIVGGA